MFDLHVLLHTIWPLLFFTDSRTYYFRRYFFSPNLVFPIHTLCLLDSISYSLLRHCFCFTQSRIHHSDIVLFYSLSYSPLRHCFCFIQSRIHHSHIVFASLDLVFTIETLFLFHSITYSPFRHCFVSLNLVFTIETLFLFHSISHSPFEHAFVSFIIVLTIWTLHLLGFITLVLLAGTRVGILTLCIFPLLTAALQC